MFIKISLNILSPLYNNVTNKCRILFIFFYYFFLGGAPPLNPPLCAQPFQQEVRVITKEIYHAPPAQHK